MRIAQSPEVRVLVDAAAGLGEGPCWDHREGVLWWVDVTRGLLHRYDPGSGIDQKRRLPTPASAVILHRSGGLVLAMRKGYYRYDPASEDLELLCEVEPDAADHRLNDAKADAAGRIWGGTMADDEAKDAGAFYRYEAGAPLELVWDQVTCSNGIGWSPDGQRMYYIDSGQRRVDVCTFDSAGGLPRNRRPFAQIDQPAEPDGLTVDAEGGIWVALWAGSQLRRYQADGSLDLVVRLPALNVTSCAFGGNDLDTLFVTSATIQTNPAQRADYPHCGALFAIRPGVRGMETFMYREVEAPSSL